MAKLKRVLSFRDVLFIAIGQIIGAGVITLTGIAIGMTGPSVMFAFLGAAVLVLIVSMLFMMGGATIPTTGAFYIWPSRLVSGRMASFVLWLVMLNSVTLALYGASIGTYLHHGFRLLSPDMWGIVKALKSLSPNMWGVVIVTLFYIANFFGLRIVVGVQMVLVVILLSALILYAGFSIPFLQVENFTPMFAKGPGGFFMAMTILVFATGGAYLVVALGGEMKNPKKDIPRVVVTSTLGVAIFYALVGMAAVGVIPWQKMVNQPLTVAGEAFLPGWALIYFIICGAGLAIGTTINAQYIQLPRNFLSACWDEVLPARFGKLNRFGTPYYITTALFIIGVIPLLLDLQIDVLAKAATISAFLPVIFIIWSITRIPDKFPEEYANAYFKISRFWLWPIFVISELYMLIGIILLARDLSKGVLIVLAVWIVISAAYYPIRKWYLRITKGKDLDAAANDLTILEHF